MGFQAKQVTGAFQAGTKTVGLSFPNDFVAVSRRMAEEVKVGDSDVVFVGYGVVAPEYGWDDYKGLDVRGKTLIMLVNDPAVADPNNPAKLDPAAFRGPAMTYYGRWTYKYEIASEKGAAAAILVHETGPAGYPFEVVKGSWSRENFDIAQPSGSQAPVRVAIEGWISLEKATELFQACGRDFQALKQSAATVISGRSLWVATAGFHHQRACVKSSRETWSPGFRHDPVLKNETVIYTAHWDHLGRDPALRETRSITVPRIMRRGSLGARDRPRILARRPPPKRSILFLAVTAEEKGLLGAKYYAAHPLYPLEARWPISIST